jgi:uncharacterized UPF0160 family protein
MRSSLRRLIKPVVARSMSTKRTKMSIGTHSGTFHCDEALGCYLLRKTSKFADASIIRSRDPVILADLPVVIDVGGVYDPASDRYDHHQRGFTEVFGHGFNTKLSSAGLVYKHYGRELVARAMDLPADHHSVETVYLAVYRGFMEAIDAIDNGVNQYDTNSPPKYISNTDLSARVSKLNPEWNQPTSETIENENFLKAVALTGSEFEAALHYYAKSWLPGRDFVVDALKKRKEVDSSGEILKLDDFCPWKGHLYDLETEMGIEGQVKYVLYHDEREDKWRIQAVSASPGSFESRKALPAAWRGLRGEELNKVVGVDGCVFCHASGFIGGNDTLEGVVEMAKKALSAIE